MNPEELREDFPIFEERPELVYLDNAATSQKPEAVIRAVEEFYVYHNSNVGRGLYELAGEATEKYRASRNIVSDLIGARADETVFTSGCTEGMNFLATTLETGNVIVPEMAHHSEQLPWRKQGHNVNFVPTNEGKIDIEFLKQNISSETDYVSLSHVSNIFGAENPVNQVADIAHDHGAKLILDAAQSVPRMETDVKEMNADFMVFSGHKMLGPTGIGALYGRKELLEDLPPYKVGGGMVRKVQKQSVQYEKPPEKFEAGTQNIAGAIGMKEAAEFLEIVGRENIRSHENELVKNAARKLKNIDGVNVISPSNSSILSFTAEFAHPHDIAEIMNQEGICVRAGHHCAQPQMEQMDINGSARISPYLYNTSEEMDQAVEAVKKARQVFS